MIKTKSKWYVSGTPCIIVHYLNHKFYKQKKNEHALNLNKTTQNM